MRRLTWVANSAVSEEGPGGVVQACDTTGAGVVTRGRARPRVLYISPCLPPIGGPESVAVLKKLRILARYLDLTVLAAEDRGGYFPLSNDPELERLLPPSVRILRVPVPGRGVWNRALYLAGQGLFTHSTVLDAYMLRWARRALRYAERENWFRDFDGMISNASPVISHYVARGIRQRAPALRWIQHYSDPFVDRTYRHYTPLSLAVDRHYARGFAREADLITGTSAETRDTMFEAYGSAAERDYKAKCLVVPHTFDPELFRLAAERYPEARRVARPAGDAFHLTYLGHFYGARTLAPVFRFLDHLRRTGTRIGGRELRVHVFGTLNARDVPRVRSQYRGRIVVHEPVGYLESLAIMQQCDALLVVDANAQGPSVYFPSKLADYLGAGRPVLAFTPPQGCSARIVTETGHLAVSAHPSDEELTVAADYLISAGRAPMPNSEYATGEIHYQAMLEFLGAA